jgi:hypothetical protein
MTCYASENFPSKADFKRAVAKGAQIHVRELTPFGESLKEHDKSCTVSGPWYPKPHTWYATCVIVDGIVKGVK